MPSFPRGGVPDSSPQALQEALFLHPPPTPTHQHRPTTAISPPSTLWKVLPCRPAHVPMPSSQPCSWLGVTPLGSPDKLRPPSPRGAALPGPWVSFGPLSSPSPRERIPPRWRAETLPGSLALVASSLMAGPGTSGSGMSLTPAPSSPPYVFLNLRYLIQLARPGIQLKMLSGLAQNYIFGYF